LKGFFMPQHFAVEVAMVDRPSDLAAFRSLALTPGVTIDRLWNWMKARGYKAARSSVGNYVQWLKRSSLGEFAPMLGDDDAGNLKLINDIAIKLSSEQIRMVALFVQFLSKLNAGHSSPVSGPAGRVRAGKAKAARVARCSTPH
jgi:hypothetical protein